MPRPPAPLHQVHDIEVLLRAHHPVVFIETIEDERAEVLLEHLADHMSMPLFKWQPLRGLRASGATSPLTNTGQLDQCLAHIRSHTRPALFYLRDAESMFDDASLLARLKDVHQILWQHQGAIVLSGVGTYELSEAAARLVTCVTLEPPSDEEYHGYLSNLLRDLRKRQRVTMRLRSEDVRSLIDRLRGLTFFEIKKIITQSIAEDWSFDRGAILRAIEAKKEIVRQSGVLELSSAVGSIDDIAGLEQLKAWLRKRKAAFADPHGAESFGLSPPRGVLLLGVPGCGKSLSAKAVAGEYGLPLVRLDPARLYTKYMGETEKNLKRAITMAEHMAPIVLWIDEIEKAFAPSGGSQDGGTSQRVFGNFLSWMQEREAPVFVVATCNDIAQLPPEMLRKGRFDEIFFVDLPVIEARVEIYRLQIAARKRDPEAFDLEMLAAASDGFSGAEIEQVVVSALYAAYAEDRELTTADLRAEIEKTNPLSMTMSEKIDKLRAWASERAVAAGGGSSDG